MVVVKKDQTTQMVGANELYADASDLGLKPGEWPQFIAVVDDENEGYLFERGNLHVQNEELMAVTYRSLDGAIELMVMND